MYSPTLPSFLCLLFIWGEGIEREREREQEEKLKEGERGNKKRKTCWVIFKKAFSLYE